MSQKLVLINLRATMITEKTFKERAMLFATLAAAAYSDKKGATKVAKKLGFTTTVFYDKAGAQAYKFMNKTDLVIACRGTEPTQWNDIKADLRAVPVAAETVSRVHKGFKLEVDELWPMIMVDIMKHAAKRKVWFTGHSLGAAMTTIMASRCAEGADVQEVYTFGSPRVGWRKYCNSLNVVHHRFVNNNDIVARVPLAIMGYRHHGTEHYFNSKGKLAKMTWRDRARGMWDGLKKGSIDIIADHSMTQYINCIEKMED